MRHELDKRKPASAAASRMLVSPVEVNSRFDGSKVMVKDRGVMARSGRFNDDRATVRQVADGIGGGVANGERHLD